VRESRHWSRAVERWCHAQIIVQASRRLLDRGLGLVMQVTLMSVGLYHEPNGVWLPSVLYQKSISNRIGNGEPALWRITKEA
jgi:hypothetical protein